MRSLAVLLLCSTSILAAEPPDRPVDVRSVHESSSLQRVMPQSGTVSSFVRSIDMTFDAFRSRNGYVTSCS